MSDRCGTRIIFVSPNVEALAARRAVIEVVNGPDRGKRLELGERASAVIGVDPDADLVLTDDSVSRRHAEIRAEPDGYLLRDLGSTNGILVGSARVPECTLAADSQIVSLGETDLRMSILDEEVRHDMSASSNFGSVLGQAPAMRQVFSLLDRAAATDSTVLLEGESGTGKEVIADSIHRASSRHKGPMVVIDCSTIPPNLIESELFGYEKGAFTGARAARPGAIEQASGGTLFLDEIGELPLEMQPKFLRVLERRQVKRVGSTQYRNVNLRVIAATNRDLARWSTEGKFRSDLYYRLSVVQVWIPPLRHRKQDIPLLARHFVQQLRPEADAGDPLTGGVLAALCSYDWPGNVRELRNAIERLLALGDLALGEGPAAEAIATTHLLPVDYHSARRVAIDRFERAYCQALVQSVGGVVARAAERAGISRQLFHRLLRRHEIRAVGAGAALTI
jgi:DNA-binding NtrC family response regulator